MVLINTSGIIVNIWPSIKVKGYAENALAKIQELSCLGINVWMAIRIFQLSNLEFLVFIQKNYFCQIALKILFLKEYLLLLINNG